VFILRWWGVIIRRVYIEMVGLIFDVFILRWWGLLLDVFILRWWVYY